MVQNNDSALNEPVITLCSDVSTVRTNTVRTYDKSNDVLHSVSSKIRIEGSYLVPDT